ncbi:MAG: diguanylate cyclase [Natronospirillum sp.]|uniref:sensor domain-containing diguanylate cyclase n=1 Tax=Natronospirillum sp. TaxID=2812955 RepID=UPI0025E5C7D9|nr:diguanylate cyclase [Natronospirillum sp.]MCH8550811.1 diguanylate cyclase [Natronospirillum sp.]
MASESGHIRTGREHDSSESEAESRHSPVLFICLLLAFWLAGLAYLGWSYADSNRQYQSFGQQQIEQRTQLIAQMQSELISSRLEAVDQSLRTLRQYILTIDNDIEALEPLLRAQVTPVPHITELLYIDLQGDVVAWTVPDEAPPNVFDRDYFQMHLQGEDRPFVSLPMTARIQEQTSFIAVSRPVLDEAGNMIGVIAAALDLENLSLSLSEVTDNPYLRSVVIHPGGEILLSSPYVSTQPGQRIDHVPEAQQNFYSPGQVIIDYAPEEAPRQVAFNPLSNWELIVLAGEDRRPLLNDFAAFARDQQLRHSLIALVGTLLLIAIGWLLYRRLQALARLAEGERALAASHQRNKAIVRALPDLLVTVSAQGKVLDYESGEEIGLPLPPHRFLGQHIVRALPKGLARKVQEYVRLTLATERMHAFEHQLAIEGEERYFEVRSAPLGNDAALLIILDITARKTAQKKLQWQATHDSLTGLPNRVLFYDRLGQAIASAQRYQQPVSLLYMDLDGFKAVNDSLGHSAGDQLLQEVAHRLQNTVRGSDTVARLSGDEFALVAHQCAHERACKLADKLGQALAEDYQLGPHRASITVSIGIAVCPHDGSSPDQLVRAADQAMYKVKYERQGRTTAV